MRTVALAATGALALGGCGADDGRVDARAVERASQGIGEVCASRSPVDREALSTDVGILSAEYAKDPDGSFRFAGGQRTTTMRAELDQAYVTLAVCDPRQAELVRRLLAR